MAIPPVRRLRSCFPSVLCAACLLCSLNPARPPRRDAQAQSTIAAPSADLFIDRAGKLLLHGKPQQLRLAVDKCALPPCPDYERISMVGCRHEHSRPAAGSCDGVQGIQGAAAREAAAYAGSAAALVGRAQSAANTKPPHAAARRFSPMVRARRRALICESFPHLMPPLFCRPSHILSFFRH